MQESSYYREQANQFPACLEGLVSNDSQKDHDIRLRHVTALSGFLEFSGEACIRHIIHRRHDWRRRESRSWTKLLVHDWRPAFIYRPGTPRKIASWCRAGIGESSSLGRKLILRIDGCERLINPIPTFLVWNPSIIFSMKIPGPGFIPILFLFLAIVALPTVLIFMQVN
ncbi:uncharacterized protein VTP21DRAFT_1055 [Calcarisporiella thermophila]|uniref:uncharacterized protein n=1 Tax=Calcarisporiella thermophila TaxID=911321 RepID=UPI003742826B